MKLSKLIFSKINTLLKSFKTISLEQMDKVQLMNRVDTKYIIAAEQLPNILKSIQNW